jgi:hypothetical protein
MQRAARGVERQIAQLVEDHEVEAYHAFRDLAGLFPFEGVDERDGRDEADLAAVVLDELDADGGGDMGLAGAGSADQHDVLSCVEEAALVQLAHRGPVDLAGGEIEADEILVGRGDADEETIRWIVSPPNPPS